MTRVYTTADLESIIEGWQYWCPVNTCRNRTCRVGSETDKLKIGDGNGDTKYLIVRTLTCERCGYPLVLGTNVYYNQSKGWGARGQVMTTSNAKMFSRLDVSPHSTPPYQPQEYIAFTEPVQERELPKDLNKKIVASFREAEYAVAKNKPISSASSIRNTVRLVVEGNGIVEDSLKEAIKKLPFDKAYIDAIGNLKVLGDDTLHYEEYKMEDLRPAIEVLALALNQHATQLSNLAQLHKAVSDKGSTKAKTNTKTQV